MNREQITELAHKDPRFQQGVDTAEEMLQQLPIMPEDMDEAIQLLEFALNNPDKYGEIREAAIKDGYVTEDDMPPEFNAVFLVSILVALYGLQDRLKTRGYARGGLAVAGRRLAAQGRGGDSMLAHINPREAEMLKRMGGSGTTNPHTGLPEYGFFSSIFKAIIPIALSFIAPGIGTAIGGAISGALGLGLGAAGTAALGAGVVGAGVGAISGGGLKGALLGGLTAGAGNYLMGPAGLGITGEGGLLSKATDSMGLTGAGGLFGSGTVDPNAATTYTSDGIPIEPGSLGNDGVYGQLGTAAGEAETAAMEAKMGMIPGGGGSPLVSNAVSQTQGSAAAPDMGSLADAPLPASRPTGFDLSAIGGDARSPSGSVLDSLKEKASNFGLRDAINLAPLALTAGSLLSQPQAVQQAAQSLSPSQQEYFNRPSVTWNWDQMQADADRNNMSLGDYMSSNWNNLTGGQYNNPQGETVAAAKGGALNQISNLAKGSGSGRDDTINARLSDGEYVMDAETVALLGDGSNDEGARRLDHMRKQLRAQKGKALAKGKFSPNAKSPLAYFKGAV
jgi:hypothetical protein